MSTTAMHKTYLITGANRGIGLGLSAQYLAQCNTTIIASLRNGDSSTDALKDLTKGEGSRLFLVHIDSTSDTDAKKVAAALADEYHITHLDCVIANASLQNLIFDRVDSVDPQQLQQHFSTNTLGTLTLFQAMLPLLKKSTMGPKFVLLGTPAGSIGAMHERPIPMSAYGVSKAAAHYLVRKMHYENDDLIAFAVDPGFVQTDAGNEAAQMFGMEHAATSVDESVRYLVKTIDKATREDTSGQFPSIEGRNLVW